jgi:hypothetical protein
MKPRKESKMVKVRPEFAEWARGWSGVNGGNPNGALWVCGLEFGTGEETPTLDRSRERYAIEGVPAWTQDFIRDYREQILKSPFIGKLAKVVLAFEGRPIKDYRDFRLNGLLMPAGTAFHINLYPMSFRNMHGGHWSREHFELTGHPNKLLYKAWCMEHRFPWLAEQVRHAAPKVLVCTGTSYAEDFRFAFTTDPFDDGAKWTLPSGKRVEEHSINEGKTRLLITPFFGQGGLMKDEDLEALGRHASYGTRGASAG